MASIFHYPPVQDHWPPVGFPGLELIKEESSSVKGQGAQPFLSYQNKISPAITHSGWG